MMLEVERLTLGRPNLGAESLLAIDDVFFKDRLLDLLFAYQLRGDFRVAFENSLFFTHFIDENEEKD